MCVCHCEGETPCKLIPCRDYRSSNQKKEKESERERDRDVFLFFLVTDINTDTFCLYNGVSVMNNISCRWVKMEKCNGTTFAAVETQKGESAVVNAEVTVVSKS